MRSPERRPDDRGRLWTSVFIPGATSGIGLGLARRFADAGSTVIVGGRRRQLIDEITSGHERIEGVVIDTSDPHSISTVAHQVQTRWPRTDTLITMAGIMPDEDWLGDFLSAAEASITVNLLGPVRLMGAFLPFLLAQPEATIVNVASGLAFVPLADSPAYCAAKAESPAPGCRRTDGRHASPRRRSGSPHSSDRSGASGWQGNPAVDSVPHA